jgi:DNA repair photolyase
MSTLPPGLRPVANPPNPWASTDVEYLDEVMGPDGPERGAPIARLQVIEDSTRKIIADNDSPDVGFRWSVNPYRGCFHACAYCLSGDTAILMADGTTKPLGAIAVGDTIYGTTVRGDYRRYTKTTVLAHWRTVKPAYRITLANGAELVASGDHRFLTQGGWKYVDAEVAEIPHRRAGLLGDDALMGPGADLCAGAMRRQLEEWPVDSNPSLRVARVEPMGIATELFDITTGTGDFIANGVVSHNCYARPGHEYLSMGAGTDFDRKIVVKPEAPKLLREAFDKRSWKGEFVMFSGVTDCYQPLEASYRLTRGCLEVCAEYRNPCGVITKAPLIERDLDLLVELTRVTDFGVTMSIPFWDPDKARAIEPYVATPQRRMKAVERLAKAGVKVGVNVAPLIPGLGDEDVPAILEAARDAGACRANFVFLRLPGPVAQVFEERLRATLPLRAEKVLSRVREARGGKLYDSRFGVRQVGEGPYAQAAMALFEATAKRLGLETGCNKGGDDGETTFQRPPAKGQMRLF